MDFNGGRLALMDSRLCSATLVDGIMMRLLALMIAYIYHAFTYAHSHDTHRGDQHGQDRHGGQAWNGVGGIEKAYT